MQCFPSLPARQCSPTSAFVHPKSFLVEYARFQVPDFPKGTSPNTSNLSASEDFSNPSTVDDDFGLPTPPMDV
ncbi:hypothetical protein E2562_003270 [Oryza meyeriana var. granulata]|uniref:Uncharacterized protein n=1 Tax=Oryza meyeriana var. granulata TaxID=110450 RepID=A0A6G1EGE9_9ORYZ|nr:hypothetical protein E2562_003270 [Oryza meyeriana var. granulata]